MVASDTRGSATLLVPALNSPNDHSLSGRPSMSSMRSINTVVDKNPELPDPKPFPKPSQTWMPNPKLTLWQRIKGIFEPDTLFRDMLDALEKRDAAGPQIDEKWPPQEDNPFIVIVSAWPKVNPCKETFISAKCVFDTGCQQGNLVSKDLALHLGFTPSDFKQLYPREQHGGKTATGDILKVEGALNLTWHEGANSMVFRDMRFLVCPTESFDMIVGSRSIRKHHLISPPNLGLSEVGVRHYNPENDEEYKKLCDELATLKSAVENVEEEIDQKKKKKAPSSIITELEKQLKQKQADLEAKKTEVSNREGELAKLAELEEQQAAELQKSNSGGQEGGSKKRKGFSIPGFNRPKGPKRRSTRDGSPKLSLKKE